MSGSSGPNEMPETVLRWNATTIRHAAARSASRPELRRRSGVMVDAGSAGRAGVDGGRVGAVVGIGLAGDLRLTERREQAHEHVDQEPRRREGREGDGG